MFTIYTPPVPNKQPRMARNGHVYDPNKSEKEKIRWQISQYAPSEPLSGPVIVDYTFFLPIPKSTSKAMRRQMIANTLYHIKKPDIDNLAYLVTNAMTGIIYKDDSQIVRQSIEKRYDEAPRTIIRIIEL